ncbi:MAG TPA: hypothetical protein VHC97_23330 [Thermoanaerobaculia bacterium]|jgi:hypothetical protein|nr:hypothetical protein [Thermoanaerobaculia bacterium]
MATLGRVQSIAAATLAAAFLLTAAWLYRGLFMDDAYTGFRYVANLLDGRGFVFNPPEHVEGVTNAGWLLFLTPLAAVIAPPLAAKAASLVLLAATLALLAATAARAARPVPVLTVLTTAFHAELVGFSLLGMETALLAFLVTAMVVLPERRRFGWLPALGTFAFLVHPEAGLVAPLGAALAWRTGALPGRAALRTAVACGLGIATATLARWLYFGELLPNTFAAKPAVAGIVKQNLLDFALGSSVNLGFPFAGLFALPFAVAGWRALRRTAPLTASFAAAAGLSGLVFSLYARPDWTLLARYFAPYAPCAYLLLWSGLLEAERAVLAGDRRGRQAAAVGAALAALGGAIAFALLGGGEAAPFLWIGLAAVWVAMTETGRRLRWKAGVATTALAVLITAHGAVSVIGWTTERERLTSPGYIVTSKTLVGPALWMRDHLPAGATIATRRIGALAYWSGHPVFDYSFGLTEPAVARLIRRRGGMFNSPIDPELAEIWRERAPDYILEDRDVLYGAAASVGGTPESFRVHGFEYRVIRRFRIARGMDWVLAGRHQPGGKKSFPSLSRLRDGAHLIQ